MSKLARLESDIEMRKRLEERWPQAPLEPRHPTAKPVSDSAKEDGDGRQGEEAPQ